MQNNKPLHLMRLGIHAEQQYFEYNKDKYDVIVFTANLAHHFASATATLMTNKLIGKKFIIDPLTHAFGHQPEYISTISKDGSKKIKPSLVSLAEEYGPPISTAVADMRQINSTDFSSSKSIEQFSKRVINFQANFLASAIDPSDRKYIPDVDATLKPHFLIAPYFYMKSTTINDWLEINKKLFVASKKLAGESKLYAEIVIDRGILENDDEIEEVANSYLALNECDGYLLWISDLSEHKSSSSTLSGFRKLVEKLSQNHKNQVINLYGGYYSLLLAKFGMTGICHGPGYGEDRDVIPVGGGIPVSKYYLNPVHQRLLFRDVQFMVAGDVWQNTDEFFKEVCSGDVCKSVLLDDLKNNFEKFGNEIVKENKGRTYSYPTTEARILTTQHYIEAKDLEFKDVANKELPALVDQLKEALGRYDKKMPGARLRYLDTWINALKV